MAYARLQLRGDTAANWASANPTLAARELALETDTSKFKIGDGVTAWNSLPYGGIAGQGVPTGGTAGQVLAKNSSTNYDTEWIDPPAGGGGGLTWLTVAANTNPIAAGTGYIVTGSRTMTLPASVPAGDEFVVHAYDATVTIASNGNVINGVGSGNNLTIAAGETAHLVGRSTGNLEIV